MLFMVIEHFKDTKAIGERFKLRGRMLPESVVYVSSWIDPARDRCFQVMEAPSAAHLEPWVRAWEDLGSFEIVPVLTSKEFWVQRESGAV
jgi:hypothetical protein